MVSAETETTNGDSTGWKRQTGQTDQTRWRVHTMTSQEAWEAVTTQPQLPKDSNIK